MGLDVVELIMAVEEDFQIVIGDLEAENLATVGDIYLLVLKKLGLEMEMPLFCPSQRIFYRFRELLVEKYNVSFEAIHPKTSLQIFVPQKKKPRQDFWEMLGKDLDLRVPNLEKPLWIQKMESLVLEVSMITGFICTVLLGLHWLFAIISVFSLFMLISILIINLYSLLLYELPATNIRELIDKIVSINLDRIAVPSSSNQAIFDKLQKIFVRQIGVSIDEVTFEKNIINDLGVD